MNEWAFAAEIKSWWDKELGTHPQWKLTRCEVEKNSEGSRERSDLSIIGGGVVYLCGELRLPDHPLSSPWHPENLQNAINKAHAHGCRWCFTSDAKTFLLIDANRTGPPQRCIVWSHDLASFESRKELDSSTFLARVQEEWVSLLKELGPLIVGIAQPKGLAVDEIFINSLHALLAGPVSAIQEELNRRRTLDAGFERDLISWMVDDQGWNHLPDQWEQETLRTARLTAYVFVTRLVFYEALRRSQPSLDPLGFPEGTKSNVARGIFQVYFSEARRRSGDYETVFAWDRAAEFALIADAGIFGWRRVVEHLGTFDLANLGFDVLGKLFERLIDPHERYLWGQHYTQPDVVDLMLSFAIPSGEGAILDPAVGGGTFLVRAYVRKHVLQPNRTHQELLAELYGLDVSAFAANLATVNLGVRSLQFADNYPRVAARSFFSVSPAGEFMSLPAPRATGLSDKGSCPVVIDNVAAIVCNPPYIRLHQLGRDRQREAERILHMPARRVPLPSRLKGAANYHLYFWFHGAQFLRPNGRIAFITSGEWMDSDYGVILQEWLLRNFLVECCVESLAEPWFSEARVGTVVLSARLCADPVARSANRVRFVILRRGLRDLYGDTEDEASHLTRVDALRDRILSLEGEVGESDDMDWSIVSQGDLLRLGLSEAD